MKNEDLPTLLISTLPIADHPHQVESFPPFILSSNLCKMTKMSKTTFGVQNMEGRKINFFQSLVFLLIVMPCFLTNCY